MSTMIESLAQTRHAERYRASQRPAAAPSGFGLENTRSRAGWLLVGLGLRLALPGRHAAPRRIALIGR
ncbi:MAG: hypothetical protein KGL15_08250 [Acidobacteriota bacterium]|nr:hypothetical protein [Acidobacteriota bacterium]